MPTLTKTGVSVGTKVLLAVLAGSALLAAFTVTKLSTDKTKPILNVSVNAESPRGTLAPPELGKLVAKFNLVASNKDVELRGIKIAYTGTYSANMLNNWKLKDEAGNVLAQAEDASKLINFTFSRPYVIAKGQTKNISVHVDVEKINTKSSFQLSIKNAAQIITNGKVTGKFPVTAGLWTNEVAQAELAILLGMPCGGMTVPGFQKNIFNTLFSAGASNDVKVTGLKFLISGDIPLSQLANFKLKDVQTNQDIAIGALNGNRIEFKNMSLIISAGATRNIRLMADVNEAQANNVLSVSLQSVSDVTSNARVVGSTLPISCSWFY